VQHTLSPKQDIDYLAWKRGEKKLWKIVESDGVEIFKKLNKIYIIIPTD